MKRRINPCGVVASAGLVIGIPAGVTTAQTIEWAAPVSGDWTNAANWSPSRLPDPSDSVLIGGAGAYEVTHNAPSGSVLELAITNPGATLAILGGRTVTINGGLVNNGLLAVNANSVNATTTLSFGASASIIGDGLIRLNRSGSLANLASSAGAVITHGPDHTIAGYGQIAAEMVNNGTIDADVQNETLRITGSAKANNGLMAASAGTLEYFNVSVAQTGAGLILADGGEVLIGLGVTIEGGQLVSNPGSRVVRSSGTSTLSDVAFTGTLDIVGGSTVAVAGAGLTNDGVITVNSNEVNSTTAIRFDQSGLLDGSGVVRLNRQTSLAQITAAADQVVTNGTDHTIAGFGQITAELVNNGVIDADMEDQPLRVTGSAKTNNTLMTASAGTLELLNATVVQGAQGLILADGGEVLINSGVSIDGGRIESEPGSRVVRSSGTSTLKDVSFAGTMDIVGGSTVAVAGAGLTNDGVITLNSGQQNATTTIRFDESGLLDGSGVVRLNWPTSLAQITAAADQVVTHGTDHTIAGFGQITAEMVNNGTIDADVQNETLRITGSAKANNGLMAASAGTLEFLNVTVAQTGDGLILADGGEVLINSGVSIDGGRIESEPGSRVVRSSGTSTLKDVSFAGTMDIVGGATLAVTGAGLTNDGLITVNSNEVNATTAIRFDEDGTLGGSGVVRLNRTTSLAQITTASNVSAEIGETQTVTGIGRIIGEITLRGVTAPGLEDPGAMDFNGDITLAPTHTLELRIAGPSSSSANYDRITGNATVQLGGTLSVEPVDYTPDFGQSYTILAGASNGVGGKFAEVVASAPLPQGLVYRLVYAPNQVRLNVTCIADMNGDFVIDADDFFEFLSLFAAGDPQADINEDGVIDADDFFAFLSLFAAGC